MCTNDSWITNSSCPFTKEDYVLLARIAEQAERYEDMAAAMKKVTAMTSELTADERNLLSVAYKNVIGARRSALRIVCSIEAKFAKEPAKLTGSEKTRVQIECELTSICKELMELIDTRLLPNSNDAECIVFYKKMKGDYYRYLAEMSKSDTRQENIDKAQKAYEEATEKASELSYTNPIRLGLALNYSVFFYEIMENSSKACELAKKTFDDAISELETLKDEGAKDSTLIMQLLRDNLSLWTSEMEEQNEGNQ